MSGLYHRALTLIQQRAPLNRVSKDGAVEDETQAISPEEREKILSDIDEIVARNRIDTKLIIFSPKHSGSLLPILINLSALAVIVLGISAASFFFNKREESIVTSHTILKTAEGKLIETLRKETEEQLNQKDREINDIQSRLKAFKDERGKLKLESEEQIRRKEQELIDSMARELEIERQKLQGTDLTEEMIAERLRAMEEEKRGEYELQIEALNQQAEEELIEREKAIASMITEFEQSLSQAQTDKSRIQSELENRQAALESQYEERETALKSDRARAIEQLNQLQEQQEREQLILDQILSSYAKVNEKLKSGEFESGLEGLRDLKSFLDRDSIALLPKIQERLPVELFLIRSLEQLIKKEIAGTEDSQSRMPSSDIIGLITSIIEQGNDHFDQSDYPAAQALYLSAMAEIPALELSYNKLREIEDISLKKEEQQLARVISRGNAYYLAGNFKEAVEQYGKALKYLEGDRNSIDQMLNGIIQSGYQLKAVDDLATLGRLETAEAVRMTRLERLRTVAREYANLTNNTEESTEASHEALLALLETKLLLRQITASREVRNLYPELYNKIEEYFDKTERYFQTFGQEKSEDAQYATLQDINALLDSLIDPDDTTLDLLEHYEARSQRELLLELIDKLQMLLQ